MVVGAPGEDGAGTENTNDASQSGAAYVFVRNGSSWSQEAYLKASTRGGEDAFGTAVAIYGSTIVVGAPGEDSNATGVGGNQLNDSALDSGAAYVFVGSSGVWTQTAYLKASNTDARNGFGQSVAIDDSKIAVGAPFQNGSDAGLDGSGAVFVFTYYGTVWSLRV